MSDIVDLILAGVPRTKEKSGITMLGTTVEDAPIRQLFPTLTPSLITDALANITLSPTVVAWHITICPMVTPLPIYTSSSP